MEQLEQLVSIWHLPLKVFALIFGSFLAFLPPLELEAGSFLTVTFFKGRGFVWGAPGLSLSLLVWGLVLPPLPWMFA